jgi:hypothetical protein
MAIAQMGIHLVFFLHISTSPDIANNELALAAGFRQSAAAIAARTAGLSPGAQKIAKSCIRLAVLDQTRGSQAEIEGIRTLMGSDETRRRVTGFLVRRRLRR